MRKIPNLKTIKFQSTDTLIGAGTTIEGKLICNASIRIDGTVRGDIECKGDLYVGENAVLHSDVKASNIYHAGKIHGSVTTNGTLQISRNGKVYGNLDVAKLQVAEGAVFEGSIIMKEENVRPASQQQKNDRVKPVRRQSV